MSDEANPHIDQIIRLKTAGQQFIDGELGVGDFEDIIKEPIASTSRTDTALEALREIDLQIERYRHHLNATEEEAVFGDKYDPSIELAALRASLIIAQNDKIIRLLSGSPDYSEAVKELVRSATASVICMNQMGTRAYQCGLEGTSDWDKVAFDLHNTREELRKALAPFNEVK